MLDLQARIVLIVIVMTGAPLVSCDRDARASDDQSDRLSIGTAESEVIKLLGPPTHTGTTFCLGQLDGHESKYRAAARSASVRYLSWHTGLANDFVCTVGFDSDNRVSFGACGGTSV